MRKKKNTPENPPEADFDFEKIVDLLTDELVEMLNIMKDCDLVTYSGAESWKPHRTFKTFKKTAKDLNITDNQFDALKDILEGQVWPFCDTIFLGDLAEEDHEHILDYCFFGEKMGWKKGDEYWIVFNIPMQRFEIRKADKEKWTPLCKMRVNKDLELRFKIGYIAYDNKLKPVEKFVKTFGVNGFPDRIELNQPFEGYEEDSQYQIGLFGVLKYFQKNATSKKQEKEISELIDAVVFDEDMKSICEAVRKMLAMNRIKFVRKYGLYREEDKNEDPEKYFEIFEKYSHELKFMQKHPEKCADYGKEKTKKKK